MSILIHIYIYIYIHTSAAAAAAHGWAGRRRAQPPDLACRSILYTISYNPHLGLINPVH